MKNVPTQDVATVAFCDAQSTSEIHEKVTNFFYFFVFSTFQIIIIKRSVFSSALSGASDASKEKGKALIQLAMLLQRNYRSAAMLLQCSATCCCNAAATKLSQCNLLLGTMQS